MEFLNGPNVYCGLVLTFLFYWLKISNAENIITELEDELFVKHDNHSGRVTIYTEANFWGIPWSLTVTNCTDVPRLFYKKASSIDTHGNCMILYGRQSCQGSRHIRIAPGTDGHSHLSAVDFDNTLASLEPCDPEEELDNSTSKHEVVHNRIRRNSSMTKLLMGTGLGGGSSSPSEISEIGNDSYNQDDGGSSDSEQQPEDDGAIDMPASLQNLNLKSVVNKGLGNTNPDDGENGWNSGRFRRTPDTQVQSETDNKDHTPNDQQTSTPHPSVPIQNVIY